VPEKNKKYTRRKLNKIVKTGIREVRKSIKLHGERERGFRYIQEKESRRQP